MEVRLPWLSGSADHSISYMSSLVWSGLSALWRLRWNLPLAFWMLALPLAADFLFSARGGLTPGHTVLLQVLVVAPAAHSCPV
jgi:hypothetical protein